MSVRYAWLFVPSGGLLVSGLIGVGKAPRALKNRYGWSLAGGPVPILRRSGPSFAASPHGPGGFGLGGLGPKALAVSRWGRLVRESARCRASSLRPCSL